MSYFVVSVPLYFVYLLFIFLCFNSKSGNLCKYLFYNLLLAIFFLKSFSIFFTGWFGMRKDFCEIFLSIFPCMKIYGNIKIVLCKNSSTNDTTNNNDSPTMIRVPLTSTNVVSQTQQRDNRFYFSKEVNKKFLESLNESKNQQNNKNISSFALLEMPD